MDRPLTTSRLCQFANVTRGQLRVYERDGLVAPPQRADNGYRIYPQSTIERLDAIRQLKEIGLTLAEIASLFRQRDNGEIDPRQLQARAAQLLSLVDARIARLSEARRFIATVAAGQTIVPGDHDCSFLVDFLTSRPPHSN